MFRLSISRNGIFDVDCNINPRYEHLGEVFARFSWQFLYNSAGGRADGRALRNSRGTRDPLRAKLQVSRTGGGLGFSRRITRRRVLTVTLCHPPRQPAPSATALTASSSSFYLAHKRDLRAMQLLQRFPQIDASFPPSPFPQRNSVIV